MGSSVVVVNQSSGFLVIDVLNALCDHYDDVSVICGERPVGIRRLKAKVSVDLACKFDKSTTIKRIFSWGVFSIQVFFKLLFKYKHSDILYYTNPPMACFCSLLLKNRFCIVEYDIYPDAFQIIGIDRRTAIFRIWASINVRLFRKAEKLFTLSEGMKQALSEYVHPDKIRVVPLWSASEDFHPVPKDKNWFIEKNHLNGKFVVLYSGNIGYTHNVEKLIDVAELLKSEKDIMFLIIGDGRKRNALEKDVREKKLENVMFLPYQKSDVLPFSLASADLGVISLDDSIPHVSVPSKTYNLLAVGAPLLAISTEDTELHRLLKIYDNGRCIPKENIIEMAAYIRELRDNPEYQKRLSANSLEASKGYTYRNAEMFVDWN